MRPLEGGGTSEIMRLATERAMYQAVNLYLINKKWVFPLGTPLSNQAALPQSWWQFGIISALSCPHCKQHSSGKALSSWKQIKSRARAGKPGSIAVLPQREKAPPGLPRPLSSCEQGGIAPTHRNGSDGKLVVKAIAWLSCFKSRISVKIMEDLKRSLLF